MEADFWHKRWEANEIGFHEGEANTLLTAHIDRLALPADAHVFLPLCGKTRDIHWLLNRGYRLTGAELSELAIRQLFGELELTPQISQQGKLTRYQAGRVCIYVGDIFDVTAEQLGPVDAVYDRAALVALPEDVRKRYTAHLIEMTNTAPQLLISFEYDQSLMDGPPFSISEAEVERHYADSHNVTLAETREVVGGLKTLKTASESAWLLLAA